MAEFRCERARTQMRELLVALSSENPGDDYGDVMSNLDRVLVVCSDSPNYTHRAMARRVHTASIVLSDVVEKPISGDALQPIANAIAINDEPPLVIPSTAPTRRYLRQTRQTACAQSAKALFRSLQDITELPYPGILLDRVDECADECRQNNLRFMGTISSQSIDFGKKMLDMASHMRQIKDKYAKRPHCISFGQDFYERAYRTVAEFIGSEKECPNEEVRKLWKQL